MPSRPPKTRYVRLRDRFGSDLTDEERALVEPCLPPPEKRGPQYFTWHLKDPPDRAAVLSVDEKTQIQAFGRTRKGMPMKPGQPAMKTQDYRRNGAMTLFAGLNILDRTGH